MRALLLLFAIRSTLSAAFPNANNIGDRSPNRLSNNAFDEGEERSDFTSSMLKLITSLECFREEYQLIIDSALPTHSPLRARIEAFQNNANIGVPYHTFQPENVQKAVVNSLFANSAERLAYEERANPNEFIALFIGVVRKAWIESGFPVDAFDDKYIGNYRIVIKDGSDEPIESYSVNPIAFNAINGSINSSIQNHFVDLAKKYAKERNVPRVRLFIDKMPKYVFFFPQNDFNVSEMMSKPSNYNLEFQFRMLFGLAVFSHNDYNVSVQSLLLHRKGALGNSWPVSVNPKRGLYDLTGNGFAATTPLQFLNNYKGDKENESNLKLIVLSFDKLEQMTIRRQNLANAYTFLKSADSSEANVKEIHKRNRLPKEKSPISQKRVSKRRKSLSPKSRESSTERKMETTAVFEKDTKNNFLYEIHRTPNSIATFYDYLCAVVLENDAYELVISAFRNRIPSSAFDYSLRHFEYYKNLLARVITCDFASRRATAMPSTYVVVLHVALGKVEGAEYDERFFKAALDNVTEILIQYENASSKALSDFFASMALQFAQKMISKYRYGDRQFETMKRTIETRRTRIANVSTDEIAAYFRAAIAKGGSLGEIAETYAHIEAMRATGEARAEKAFQVLAENAWERYQNSDYGFRKN